MGIIHNIKLAFYWIPIFYGYPINCLILQKNIYKNKKSFLLENKRQIDDCIHFQHKMKVEARKKLFALPLPTETVPILKQKILKNIETNKKILKNIETNKKILKNIETMPKETVRILKQTKNIERNKKY